MRVASARPPFALWLSDSTAKLRAEVAAPKVAAGRNLPFGQVTRRPSCEPKLRVACFRPFAGRQLHQPFHFPIVRVAQLSQGDFRPPPISGKVTMMMPRYNATASNRQVAGPSIKVNNITNLPAVGTRSRNSQEFIGFLGFL